MADPSKCPPLTRQSVQEAHEKIKSDIHKTPVITCRTLDHIASTNPADREIIGPPSTEDPPQNGASDAPSPKMRLFFKCENMQRIGAFKARGASHAMRRLIDERGIDDVRQRGVCTHSSGNHAQALALAAATHNVAAHIVMPSSSIACKIAGTQRLGAHVLFCGPNSADREALAADVMQRTGAYMIPPCDHPDIILGAGTQALELEAQAAEQLPPGEALDAVVAAVGGGGMVSGICTALQGTGIRVFGAEPEFEGANDAERGLREGRRIERVATRTIADGLRSPVGKIPWTVMADPARLAGVFSVSEAQICAALRLALERMKVVIEPSAAVPLAVVLFNERFRALVRARAGERPWNVGVVLSGGNTTVDAIGELFARPAEG